jgi:ABC-type multidrug transport system ATPase subunit
VKDSTGDDSPYIETRDLSLSSREGPVYADVNLSFRRGRLAAVVGRSGTGRSALLLTLAGRMRGWTGSCRVAGYDAATQTTTLRDRSSVARISDLVDLEPRLTVAESITERALIDAMPLPRAGERFDGSCAALGQLDLPRKTLVGDLSSLDRTLLAVALATLRPAELVFLDDAERGLDGEQLARLMGGLVGLVEAGTFVVVSLLDAAPLPAGSDHWRLERPSVTPAPTPPVTSSVDLSADQSTQQPAAAGGEGR